MMSMSCKYRSLGEISQANDSRLKPNDLEFIFHEPQLIAYLSIPHVSLMFATRAWILNRSYLLVFVLEPVLLL